MLSSSTAIPSGLSTSVHARPVARAHRAFPASPPPRSAAGRMSGLAFGLSALARVSPRLRPSASAAVCTRAAPRAPARAPLQARQQLDSKGVEYIRLDGFLKIQGMASTGGQAKMLIQDGMVEVNGETEVRRGKKLRHGDLVLVRGDQKPLIVEFE